MAASRSKERDNGLRAAVAITRRLQESGFTAYLAGGCVRDRLLGLRPKDYDVATDARPDQVKALFQRTRFVGEAFGVALVNHGGVRVEVATFRTEWGYEDGRRPSHVHFSDAEHDARRRDFTINGLFEDPVAGRVIDHVGGRADLEAGVIRAIGDPDERLEEDHLRMLRAVRFAAALDFRVEPATMEAVRARAPRLGNISRERIGQEVVAMFGGPRPAAAAALMQALALDGPVLNESHVDVDLPLMRAVGVAPPPTVLAAWALDREVVAGADPSVLSAPEIAGAIAAYRRHRLSGLLRRWRKALCLSNQQRDALQSVLVVAARALDWERLRVAARKHLLVAAAWGEGWRLLQALVCAAPAARGLIDRIEREQGPLRRTGLAPLPLVGGEDLIGLGMAPGPDFGRLIAEVYDAQLEGAVSTRDEALAWVQRRRARPEGKSG